MKLHRCRCDEDLYVRIPRSFWMRLLFPSRCLYYCWNCKHKMLTAHVARATHATPRRNPLAAATARY